MAAKVILPMRAPFLIAGAELAVSTSVGIAAADGHDDVDSVLSRADAALYQAKREGRGGFSIAIDSTDKAAPDGGVT